MFVAEKYKILFKNVIIICQLIYILIIPVLVIIQYCTFTLHTNIDGICCTGTPLMYLLADDLEVETCSKDVINNYLL